MKKVILYGAYARGDFQPNSDIDIIILTDLSDEEIVQCRTTIWDLAYDIQLKDTFIISPILKNVDDFSYWSDTLPFYMNINKEGVVLYGQKG